MKLRSKFALLIAGIFIIPVAITLTIGLVYLSFSVTGVEISRMMSIGIWLRQQYPMFWNGDQGNRIVPAIPPPEGLDLLILDDRGTVLYSSFPSIAKDSKQDVGKLTGNIHTGSERSLVMSESIIDKKSGKAYTVLFAIAKDSSDILLPDKTAIVFPIIFIALVLCSSVLAVVVMSRLGRSIIRLESATKHIVDGNLDFRLDAAGNDEIASLTRSFDSMRIRLKGEFEKRSRFLMAVSHDLATPLTSIEGYTEAIMDGYANDDHTRTKYLSIILDKSKVLDGRIAELIEFVRMETGEWKMTCAEVVLRDFLLHVAAIFKEDAFVLKRSYSSLIDIPESVIVTLDRNLVLRALENLFHNAVRYTHDNDAISFRATLAGPGRDIVLAIEDKGVGIPEDEILHIFDPFFRGRSFTKEKGFGLGLSTVRSIIEAHGWTISVSSKTGEGSQFGIRIPGTA